MIAFHADVPGMPSKLPIRLSMMKENDSSERLSVMETIRAGCTLVYEAKEPTPILLLCKPRLSSGQVLMEQKQMFNGQMPLEECTDSHGNTILKTVLVPGLNSFHYDAIVLVPAQPDNFSLQAEATDLANVPYEVVRYTMPSRYCESDKLAQFAQKHFGQFPRGMAQVKAICNWTHDNIEYRYGSGSTLLSACDVIARGYGVCRDFAHVMIALCRALDVPARYVAGKLPFRGVAEGDIGIDFHAYCEVYLGQQWHTFDPRYNKPHIGRIKIAHGMDAVDAAFATIYGDAAMVEFTAWAYQIDPARENLDSPVGIVKGHDGTARLTGDQVSEPTTIIPMADNPGRDPARSVFALPSA